MNDAKDKGVTEINEVSISTSVPTSESTTNLPTTQVVTNPTTEQVVKPNTTTAQVANKEVKKVEKSTSAKVLARTGVATGTMAVPTLLFSGLVALFARMRRKEENE